MKDRWQKCPVCGGRKKINSVENYPIYGQIDCPVCDGYGIIEIESGKSPKELQDHVTTKDLQDDDNAREERVTSEYMEEVRRRKQGESMEKKGYSFETGV